ncbi:MAG: MFS transporter [Xanthobacteraceae bacterium]|nr:MFS transporter [Xanthobacteraceae bacterium]
MFVMLAALFLTAGIAVAYELKSRGRQQTISSEAAGWALHRAGTMLRQPWVVIVLTTTFFEGMFFFGAFTFVGSYLWARFELGFDLVGLIVAGFGVGGLIYSASAAQLVRRLGETGLAAGGGILIAVSFVAITAAPTPLAVAPATILAGFGYYMIHNTLQTNATQMASRVRGLAVGTFARCLFLGQSIGSHSRHRCSTTPEAPLYSSLPAVFSSYLASPFVYVLSGFHDPNCCTAI